MPLIGIFENKDSVFFVGGRGTKTGDPSAGGCTNAFWDSSQTLSDVMWTDGEVMSLNSSCWAGDQTKCTITEGDGGNVRITEGAPNGFTNCVPGLVAHVKFSGIYDDDRYEVLVVNLIGGWIEIARAYSAPGNGEPTCDVKVGGAFDKLQNAVDNTDATHGYNVKIYTNKAETLTAAIDFDTTGGSIANNSQVIVEGFHTQPGDMNYGGPYYQSPLDCLINGVDTDRCVTLDADGGAYDVIAIDNFDGLVLKNLYLYNTDKASGHDCTAISNSPVNIGLINCKFDTAYAAVSGSTTIGFEMRDCYIGKDFGNSLVFSGFYTNISYFINCVFNIENLSGIWTRYRAIFEHCLFWKGTNGAYIDNAKIFNNCVFYGQTTGCIVLNEAVNASVRGHNNIFMPAEAADFVVYATTAKGSVSDDALINSCIWTIAGAAVTNHISVNGITRQLSDVIEADPQFVDAANGDFRPRNPAVLRGGKPDISGNPTQMGAILQKYQFGDRERIANMARLRIIR